MDYYETRIEPHLKSGQIEYVGEVNDQQKNALLGTACALLMPIEWNEPFGIVICEAMACGTPVIAFNHGAVPEVVKDKWSGFVCDNLTDMAWAAENTHKINRQNVRNYCEEHFSADVIVELYLKLYQSLIRE